MIKYTSKTFDKNTENQYTVWYKVLENGKEIAHRDGGLPAVEWADGCYKEWYVNGERHRNGGLPAIEQVNGCKEWYVNGKYDFSRGFPYFYNIYCETHDLTKESSNDFCDRIINRYLQENSLKPGCLVTVPKVSQYIELNSKEPNILTTNEEYDGVFIEKFNVGLNILFNNKLCSVRYDDMKRF